MYKLAEKGINPYDAVGGAGVKEQLSGLPGRILLNGATPFRGLGGLVDGFGVLGALAQDNPDGAGLKEYSANSFIPGVRAYRSTLRDMIVDSKLSKGKVVRSKIISESLGQAGTPLLGAIIGGIGSNLYSKAHGADATDTTKNTLMGVLGGAAVGAGSQLFGYLIGLFRARRAAKEHAKYLTDANSTLANYLVPGLAGYNRGRRDHMALSSFMNA